MRCAPFSIVGFIAKTLLALSAAALSPVASGTTDAIDAIDVLAPVSLIRLNASGESAVVPSAVVASLDSRPTIAAKQTVDGKTTIYLIRTLANGAVDASFGTAGRTVIAETTRCVGALALASAGANTVVVAEIGSDDDCASTTIVEYRVGATGRLDAELPINGLPAAKRSTPVQLTRGAGRLLLAAVASGGPSPTAAIPGAHVAYVAGLDARGSPAPTFGNNGIITLIEASPLVSVSARIASLANGHIVIATFVGKQVVLSEWGVGGERIALPNGAASYTFDFAAYAAGDSTVRLVHFHRLADGANLVIVQRESVASNALIIGRIAGSLQGQSGCIPTRAST